MRTFLQKSPNFWVLAASILAILGFIVMGVGSITHVSVLKLAGQILIAPIVIGGILLLLIVIPALIIYNREKTQKSHSKDDDA